MKNIAFLFCVFCSSLCFGGDADEVLSVFRANLEAANKEDVDALLATCSVDMPDREKFREESIKIWKEKDIHYSLVDFKFVEADGFFAVAEVTQKTHSKDRTHSGEGERFYRNGTGLLPDDEVVKYLVAFKKELGMWKCYLTISEPIPVK